MNRIATAFSSSCLGEPYACNWGDRAFAIMVIGFGGLFIVSALLAYMGTRNRPSNRKGGQ